MNNGEINYDNYAIFDELEDHKTYLRLLDVLECRTSVIEYVLRGRYDPNDPFCRIGKRFIINEYHTTEWTGIAEGSGMLYSFRADGSIFKLLRTYESFFGRDERKKIPIVGTTGIFMTRTKFYCFIPYLTSMKRLFLKNY